jgi:hypothetical protein
MFIDKLDTVKNIFPSSIMFEFEEEEITLSEDFIRYKKDLFSTLDFMKDCNDVEVTSKIKILIFNKIFTGDIFIKTDYSIIKPIIGDTTSIIFFNKMSGHFMDISSHLFGS